MLAHYQQTKNLLVSYSEKPMGLFWHTPTTKPSGYGRGIFATHNNLSLDWVVTFRHATIAEWYRHEGTLYTVASPATSANACFLWFFTMFFTPKSSITWLVAWFSQISLCVTLWCLWCKSKRWLRIFSWIRATANFLKYGYNLALFLFSVYDIEKQERPD